MKQRPAAEATRTQAGESERQKKALISICDRKGRERNWGFRQLFFISLALSLPLFLLYRSHYVYQGFLYLLTILRPFLIGGALAFLLKIPMNFIERRLLSHLPDPLKRFRRGLSMLAVIILLFISIGLTLSIILPQIVQAVVTLESKVKLFLHELSEQLEAHELTRGYAEQVDQWLSGLSWTQLIDNLTQYLKDGSSSLIKQAISTGNAIASGTTNAIFAFFFMLYVLSSKERLVRQGKRLVYSYLPEKRADQILYVGHLAHRNFSAFIGGQFIDAIMIAAWAYLGVLLIGMPRMMIVPVIMGVTDLVPLIGPIIGTFLSTLVVLIDSPIKAGIFFIYLLAAQQIQGNVIYPKLVGDRLGLPAMWTLVAVSLGGSLLGVVGMWLFCPLFAVIYTLLDLDTERRLYQRGIRIRQKNGAQLTAEAHAGIEQHPEYCELEIEEPGLLTKLGSLSQKFKKK